MTKGYALTSLVAMTSISLTCLPLTTKPFCPICVCAPFPANNSLPPVLVKLRECLPLSFSCSTAVSRSSHTSIADRVLAVHTRSPMWLKCFTSSLGFDVYRAFPAARSLFSRLSSPKLMIRSMASVSSPLPTLRHSKVQNREPQKISRGGLLKGIREFL